MAHAYVTLPSAIADTMLKEILEHNPDLKDEMGVFLAALQTEDMWAREEDAHYAYSAFQKSGRTQVPEYLEQYRDLVTGVALR